MYIGLDWIGKLVPYGVILIAIALLNEGNMRFRLASSSIPNTWISPRGNIANLANGVIHK